MGVLDWADREARGPRRAGRSGTRPGGCVRAEGRGPGAVKVPHADGIRLNRN